jgi:hypothetical protein
MVLGESSDDFGVGDVTGSATTPSVDRGRYVNGGEYKSVLEEHIRDS